MHKLIDRDVRIGTELPAVSKQFNVEMFKLGNVRTLHNDQAASRTPGKMIFRARSPWRRRYPR